jgi:hypothetical protein
LTKNPCPDILTFSVAEPVTPDPARNLYNFVFKMAIPVVANI